MKKQQVYKLSPKDVGNIVMKTLKESNNYRENETEMNEGGVTRERALNIIMGHTARKQAYEQLLERDPERAEKYVEFFRQNPAAKYPIWDPERKIYYNKESYSTHSGAKATPGPGIRENKRRKPVVRENQKPRRVIRLTESEMVDFIDELTKKVQRSQRRRGL